MGRGLNVSSRPSPAPSSNLALVNSAKQQYGGRSSLAAAASPAAPNANSTLAGNNDLRRRVNAANTPAASPGLAPKPGVAGPSAAATAAGRGAAAGNVSRMNESSLSASFSAGPPGRRESYIFTFSTN